MTTEFLVEAIRAAINTQKTMTLAIGRDLPLEIWAVTDGMYCLHAGSKGFLVSRGTLEECLEKAEEVDR